MKDTSDSGIPLDPHWSAEKDHAFYAWVKGGVYDRIFTTWSDDDFYDIPDNPEMLGVEILGELYTQCNTGGLQYNHHLGLTAWRELIKSGKVVLDDLP